MFDQFALAREQLQGLLKETGAVLAESGAKTLADQFALLANDLDRINYTVAVLGFMKRGKSTLVNALMRRRNDDIAPVRTLPCSSVITEYVERSSPEQPETARVYFQNADMEPKKISLAEIRDYNTEQGNPGNSKKVDHIEVIGDFPALHRAARLVDTPGKGSINTSHDVMTDQFLPRTDAIILPISADLPVDAMEKEFLQELSARQKDRVFVVLTMADTLSEEDRPEVLRYVEEQLRGTGLRTEKIFITAAKPVFAALREGLSPEAVDALAEKWGLTELERAMEEHILRHSDQARIFARRCGDALRECTLRIGETLAGIDRGLANMNVDHAQLEAKAKELEEKGKALRDAAKEQLRVFERGWNQQVNSFRKKALQKTESIADRIVDKLSDQGLLAAWSRKPAAMVAKALEPEINGLCLDLTEKLEDVVSLLKAGIDENVNVYNGRRQHGDSTAAWTNMGAKLLMLGGGAAAAGQSAAAVSSVSAAWLAVSGAATEVATAQGAQGVFAGIYYWFVGGGSVATASAAKITVATTAVGATVTAALATGGTLLAVYIGAKLIKYGLNESHAGRVPKLVEEQLTEILDETEKSLNTQRDAVKEAFSNTVEDAIEVNEKNLRDVMEAIAKHDPSLKQTLESRRIRLTHLLSRGDGVEHELLQLVSSN